MLAVTIAVGAGTLRSYNETYGATFGVVMLTSGVTPVVMDFLYDRFKNYDVALVIIGGPFTTTLFVIGCLP